MFGWVGCANVCAEEKLTKARQQNTNKYMIDEIFEFPNVTTKDKAYKLPSRIYG